MSQDFVLQTLATVFHYINTDRIDKAISVLCVLKRIAPDEPLVEMLFQTIGANQLHHDPPDLSNVFGKVWKGQDLTNCSIEVFCDQGMGDALNMMRYLYLMKDRWDCQIVVNYYAFFDAMSTLMSYFHCVDQFVCRHVRCDYVTNIMSIPSILLNLPDAPHYPAKFKEIIQYPVPEQQRIEVEPKDIKKPSVGLAWMSNRKNSLSIDKSLPVELLHVLASDRWSLINLVHKEQEIDYTIGIDFLEDPRVQSLEDVASWISGVDMVVSVDTVVLHLAGIMRKPTIGLLHSEADPRWGHDETTVWYPSVHLVRQRVAGDWQFPLEETRRILQKKFGG